MAQPKNDRTKGTPHPSYFTVGEFKAFSHGWIESELFPMRANMADALPFAALQFAAPKCSWPPIFR